MSVRTKCSGKKALFLVISAIACTNADAQVSSDNRIPFAGASPEIREFLGKAEEADRIADPLARCLAFPDLPGNKWPKGLAAAHCHYTRGPRITLSKVKELLDRNESAKLDALFAADLDRHYSKDNFSEIIHRDFFDFGTSSESDRLTRAWLEKSPKSPFAMTARGMYFREMSREARGTKVAAETPDENVKKMGEFVDLAVEQFQKALAIEPRMLPAQTTLISMGTMDSRFDLRRNAIRDAKALDPLCTVAIDFEMAALSPRWGGSFEAMLKLAEDISASTDKRPLLADNMAWPYSDFGDVLYADKNYADAIKTIKPIMTDTTKVSAYETLAKSMFASNADHYETLLYFLVAARFEEGSSFVNRTTGRMLLLDARKPLWAIKYLKRAIEESPKDAFAHYYLAQSYWHSGNLPEAESHYRISAMDPNTRQDSLLDLSTAYMRNQQPEKALAQAELLNKEYPEFSRGWLMTSGILRVLKRPGVNEALKKFIETADRSNPNTLRLVQEAEQMLKAAQD